LVLGSYLKKVLLNSRPCFEGAGPPKNAFQFYSDNSAQTLTIEEHDPYEHELRYFVDSIQGKAEPGLLDAQPAKEALKLSLATLQSVRENRAIKLDG
jgi:predicted dehydrogenase